MNKQVCIRLLRLLRRCSCQSKTCRSTLTSIMLACLLISSMLPASANAETSGSLGARNGLGTAGSFSPASITPETRLTGAGRPLSDLLNANGTLDLSTGFRGSLDGRGWRMVSRPEEAPRFAPLAATGNENWADIFTLSGTTGIVYAVVISGSIVYVGGDFKCAGNVVASDIAKWDGSTWSALGSGMSYAPGSYSGGAGVRALALDDGGNLYAGGRFNRAGGVSANRIAKWDGSSWSALGSGIGSAGTYYDGTSVNALAIDSSGNVYAAGNFSTAGGGSANRIAKWDGSSWSTLGSGMSSTVYALAVDGSNLYAGGYFTTAGGVVVNRIAKWDGSSWSALGSGMGSTVYALAVNGGNLYAGGSFTTAGGVSANRVAKWDGSSWSALGSGTNGTVRALAVDGSNLYAGGDFTTAGGVGANCVAKWDGSSWTGLGSGTAGGLNNIVYALAVDGSHNLFAGGDFMEAGGVTVRRVAKWNGSSWLAVGVDNSVDSSVNAIAVDGDNVYVGGSFTQAGGVVVNYIAKWDGSSWSALGSGMSSTVRALAVDGSNLYAGGWFITAGGVTANYVAKWDGSSWSALGNGISRYSGITYYWPPVQSLAVDTSSGALYVGGIFSHAGGVYVDSIAKWDGSSWESLGSGLSWSTLGSMAQAEALAMAGTNRLYAGGSFYVAGENSSYYFAQWNIPSTVDFSSVAYAVGENESMATITVTLDAASSLTATVDYATGDGTATAVSDYTAISGTLIFTPGITSRTFAVAITNDAMDEDDETVILALFNAAYANLDTTNNPAALTISDDDPLPVVDFDSPVHNIGEDDGSATITVTLSAASGKTVTVQYATSDGTATAGDDYTSASGILTFTPGVTSQSFDVIIGDDGLDENDETITLTLSNASNATIGGDNPATLTIEDDESPPAVGFSSATYSVNEEAGTSIIAVTIDALSALTITVEYTVTGGTATPGEDYVVVSGTLAFTPGVTSQSFTVDIVDDEVDEGEETIVLTLYDPTNATVGDGTAVLTITEDFKVYLPLVVRNYP